MGKDGARQLNRALPGLRIVLILALRGLLPGLGLALGLAQPGFAAVLECTGGDVACLIAAINTANANGEVNTIRLAAGVYTLTAVDNTTDGENGLPSITSTLTIAAVEAGNTIIEREATAPRFRLLHVAAAGLLRLEGITIRGGLCGSNVVACGGAGLANRGTAIISDSIVTGNQTCCSPGGGILAGGGILSFGRLVLARSTVANNQSNGGLGGGVANFGPAGATIVNSTISGNVADSGGGLATNEGSLTIIGSTIANNMAAEGSGGGLFSSGNARSVAIINSTLANNIVRLGFGNALAVGAGIIVNSTIATGTFPPPSGSAGTLSAGSALALQNTIVSGPSQPGNPMCRGRVTSLDNNFFTDPACAITLLPQDLTGDPGLGAFTDDGTPGGGYVPLLAQSPAIDAGNDAACLPTDQRGQPRVGRACDIGAIEGSRPNQPPVANAGPDQAVDATDPDGAAVTLDGTGSSDPDGDALTFTWSWATGTATGVRPTVRLPRGTITVTLTVRDPQGASAADTVQVTVRDAPPPTVQATTVNFDTPPPPGRIDGVFEGIDFGLGQWQWSSPYNVNPTNHIYFADATGTSRILRFSPAPRVLNSLRVYSVRPGTLTLSDDAGQTLTQAVSTGSLQLVTTGWTRAATTVTVSFTNGWDLGVDDITYGTAP